MTKNSCIVANIILGISIACINMVPYIMPFVIANITYVFIACFDVLAIYLSFALDFQYAKENSFGIKDIGTHVVFPLVVPMILIAITYTLIQIK